MKYILFMTNFQVKDKKRFIKAIIEGLYNFNQEKIRIKNNIIL